MQLLLVVFCGRERSVTRRSACRTSAEKGSACSRWTNSVSGNCILIVRRHGWVQSSVLNNQVSGSDSWLNNIRLYKTWLCITNKTENMTLAIFYRFKKKWGLNVSYVIYERNLEILTLTSFFIPGQFVATLRWHRLWTTYIQTGKSILRYRNCVKQYKINHSNMYQDSPWHW